MISKEHIQQITKDSIMFSYDKAKQVANATIACIDSVIHIASAMGESEIHFDIKGTYQSMFRERIDPNFCDFMPHNFSLFSAYIRKYLEEIGFEYKFETNQYTESITLKVWW